MVDQDSAALLRDPAGCIKRLFRDSLAHSGRPGAEDDYGIPGRFERAFEDDADLAKVPSLLDAPGSDAGASAGYRLARLQCYVVHADTEIYGGAWRSASEEAGWRLGRYGLDAEPEAAGEIEAAQMQPDGIAFEERTTLLCRLVDFSSADIERDLSRLAVGEGDSASHNDDDDGPVVVKLYNEKEEGLLHAFIDVVGLVEPAETGIAPVVHGLIVQQQRLASFLTASPARAFDARSAVLDRLTSVLSGDAHAAELLLLSLVSSIGAREPVLVGPLPLNLRGLTSSTARALSAYVASIAPLCRRLPLTIAELNLGRLTPRHDGERFFAGSLQLPADAVVLVDETMLAEGTLNETGLRDLQSLAAVQERQKLPFHFPYNRLELDVDCACVVLSLGKSLLPSAAAVSCPVQSPKSSSTETASATASASASTQTAPTEPEQVHQAALCRRYLASARLRRVDISEALSGRIQEEFVSLRKAHAASVSVGAATSASAPVAGTATAQGGAQGGARDGAQGEVDLAAAALTEVDGDDLAMRLRLAREIARSTAPEPAVTSTADDADADAGAGARSSGSVAMTWQHYTRASALWQECRRRNSKA